MSSYSFNCSKCNSNIMMELSLGSKEPTECFMCRTADTSTEAKPLYITTINDVVVSGTKSNPIRRKTTDAFGNPLFKS